MTSSGMISLCLLLLLSPEIPLTRAQSGTNGVNDQYYNQFSPSMAIIVVILVAALFLMGFFSIYIRNCSESQSNSVRALAGTAARSRRVARGLDPAVIETFPTLEYSVVKIHKIGKGALECAVCLCEFEDTETLRLIPKCDHVFHPECIDEWLASHTTCPVCRANLAPQPGESVHGIPVLNADLDIESQNQNDAIEAAPEQQNAEVDREHESELEVLTANRTLNRNRTRGSWSSRIRRFSFPRSHSTGHSLVQPGEDTERFTLRLPLEVRKQIINQRLHRATSLVILPRETSSRRGYRTGGDGSSRGRFSRRLDRGFKSDKWVFTMAPPFLVRASSIRTPKVANSAGEETSTQPTAPSIDSTRPPV
ncbi:hypothetical protein L6164_035069 [Bauhinia variegata]|uniref:Uncharacterized protein n=1 Tax=Bauhinia variegata TaxID=167791 RepID=A0ACB9KXF7_BAUVA|nr:hypothetical protein L6164_035069 [Bauhinia variegata]